MRYCPNCGNELNDDASMCVKCGEIINKPVSEDSDNGFWMFILSLFVPVAGIIGGAVFSSNGKKKMAKKCFVGAFIGIAVYALLAVASFVIPLIIILLNA